MLVKFLNFLFIQLISHFGLLLLLFHHDISLDYLYFIFTKKKFFIKINQVSFHIFFLKFLTTIKFILKYLHVIIYKFHFYLIILSILFHNFELIISYFNWIHYFSFIIDY